MKLKDILEFIITYDRIKIANYNGEEFYPTYADIDRYKDHYVCSVSASDKRELLISVKPNQ